MSKKFKGKRCAYCACPSSTADHVFAREFFLPEHRANLPQVPACGTCNSRKSTLEHHLTALLPFGGRHEKSGQNLVEMVPGRLDKNAKLHRDLRQRMRRMWAEESGLHVQVLAVPIDPDTLLNLFGFIVKGLVAFHWAPLDPSMSVRVVALTEAGEDYFDGLFAKNAAARVKADVGSGTFRYEGAQAVDSGQITVWRIEAYGGMKFGDPSRPGLSSRRFGALTGPEPRVDSNAA